MRGSLTYIWAAVLITVAGLAVSGSGATAQNTFDVVHFPSGNPQEIQNSSGDAQGKRGTPLWGHLSKPDGDGPHPAIVLLHGCGGILQSHLDWARHLNRAGYVTLVVDSFRPRSLISDCRGDSGSASPAGRVLDAYGALAFLTTLAFVDPERIGLIGWSHGGITALDATNTTGIGSRFDKSFKAVAAIYPYCIVDRTFAVPVIVLIGEADDWTPASECRKLEHYNKERQAGIELVIYPGVYHAFDNPSVGDGFFIPGAPGQQHWLQYDEKAHLDSKERLVAFFENAL